MNHRQHQFGEASGRYEGPASARRRRRERPTHQGTRARPVSC